MIKILKNISMIVNKGSEILCIILMAAMTILVLLQIVVRYFFNFSFSWLEELVKYMLVWTILLASSIVLEREEHFRLVLFVDRLPEKLTRIMALIFNIVICIFLLILLREGIDATIFGGEMYTASLGITFFWPYFSIPLMCGIMLIHLINILIRDVKIIFAGDFSESK